MSAIMLFFSLTFLMMNARVVARETKKVHRVIYVLTR